MWLKQLLHGIMMFGWLSFQNKFELFSMIQLIIKTNAWLCSRGTNSIENLRRNRRWRKSCVFLLIHFVTLEFLLLHLKKRRRKIPLVLIPSYCILLLLLLLQIKAQPIFLCLNSHNKKMLDWRNIKWRICSRWTNLRKRRRWSWLGVFCLILLLIMQIIVLACEEKTKIPRILSCAVSKLLHFVAVVAN